jgi:hypothetical protein
MVVMLLFMHWAISFHYGSLYPQNGKVSTPKFSFASSDSPKALRSLIYGEYTTKLCLLSLPGYYSLSQLLLELRALILIGGAYLGLLLLVFLLEVRSVIYSFLIALFFCNLSYCNAIIL